MHIVPRRSRGRPRHEGQFTSAAWRVLAALRAGRTNAEIADGLGLSVHTVRSHVSRIVTKLEVTSRRKLLPSTRGAASAAGALRCSFCQKPESRVEYLIAGPADVYICGGCIDLCNEIIAKQRGSGR